MVIEQLKNIYDKLYDVYDEVNISTFRDPELGTEVENQVSDLLKDIRELMSSIEEDK